MNRAERRLARRTMGREHAGCGCVPRYLTPVELRVEHAACGGVVQLQPIPLPTSAPVGSLKTVYVGCRCGDEVEATYLVQAL